MRWFPLVLVAACSNGSSDPVKQEKPAEARKLAGVQPEKFKCESVVPLDQLGQILGGSPRQIDNTMPVPLGVAQPCNYEITTSTGSEGWTFDFDCRDGYKQRADALFAQYRETSREAVAHYTQLDAGVSAGRPGDAGVTAHPPEPAVEVAVGAKGLDHHGEGLVFIDDDAPCYVRVTGKDAARRLALARLIAKNLTLDNAPMVPRPRH